MCLQLQAPEYDTGRYHDARVLPLQQDISTAPEFGSYVTHSMETAIEPVEVLAYTALLEQLHQT